MATGKIVLVEKGRDAGKIADAAIVKTESRPELWVYFTHRVFNGDRAIMTQGTVVEFEYDMFSAKRGNLKAISVWPADSAKPATNVKPASKVKPAAPNVFGTITHFRPDRGFGFIKASDRDYYFDKEDFEGDAVPANGTAVTFQRGTCDGKPRARNVRLAA